MVKNMCFLLRGHTFKSIVGKLILHLRHHICEFVYSIVETIMNATMSMKTSIKTFI
jgi:hypothetical protein